MKKTFLVVLMFCLILTGCGKKNEEVKEKPKDEVKEPVVEEKKISIIDMDSNSRPYAVVINNYPSAAKVQAGLNDAYIVYEFPIEGGITRSLALFKDKTDVKVGTIRSARQYYIDYVLENDAIFVHFGWNVPAQNDIKTWKIDYIDGNTRDSKAFKREKNGLATEHTVYSNLTTIVNHNKNVRKFKTTTDVKPPLHYVTDVVDLSKYEDSIVANNVKVNYSKYDVEFKYDKEKQRYDRYIKGSLHQDYFKKEVFDTKNILVVNVKTGSVAQYKDPAGNSYLDLKNIGSGDGYYITNGYARKIKWTKEARNKQTVYKYEDGTVIDVNDGNTYIMMKPTGQSVKIN